MRAQGRKGGRERWRLAKDDNRGGAALFPPEYVRFVELFNAGLYWESHEALEALWRENKSPFFKGLIIYASAFVHARRGNPRGVRKQLVKARRYLRAYRPKYMGLDVDRILERLEACLAAVCVEEPPEGERLAAAIPFDALRLLPAYVRGGEPEISGSS